jgi:outer membrane protein OmpA-like peptidoglycan-associated protein
MKDGVTMYETITYDQLKELPDDQKIEALKELKTIYPDNKDLAKHLDTAHIAISNMVGKYLEGKQVGRKKMTDEEKAQAKIEREAEKKRLKEQEKQETLAQQTTTNQEPEIDIPQPTSENATVVLVKEPIKTDSNSFSIKLEKDMLGEEAIVRLNGIANSLLKENKYKITVNVEEV